MAPDPDPDPSRDTKLQSSLVSDADETARLDTILDRIREKTPALPYIVSVPSGIPYKSAKTQYDFRESRWTPEEKHLEYSSYLYRNTASDGSILHLEAQGIPDDISVQNTPRPESRSVTDPNTPSTPSLGSKKKVSLADYKKRTKDKISTPVQSGDKVSAVESTPKPPSESGASRIAARTNASTTSQEKPRAATDLPQSRSAEHTLPKSAVRAQETTSSRPEKDQPPPMGHQSSQNSSAHPKSKPPQNMAPSQPGTTTRAQGGKPDPYATTASSSPAGLRSMAAIRGKADDIPLIQVDTIDSPLPDRLSPITSLEDLSDPVGLKDSAALPISLENPFPAIDIYLDLPTDAAFQNARKFRQDADKNANKAEQPKGSKPGDKRVANGTQERPVRKDEESRKSNIGEGPAAEASTTKALKGSNNTVKASEKRRREDADSETDSTAKRRKVSERAQAPSSPRPSAATPKSKLLLTPSKALKRKGEGTPEAATPQRGPRTPPVGASKITASPSRRWKAELSRLEGIGKALKRQSQVKADKGAERVVKERAVKLATVQGIESALCYVTAFCANDQIKPTHQSWRSLSPLLDELIQRTDGHSHLQGLCYLIRAACCSRSVSILNSVKPGDMHDADKLREHLVAVQTYVHRADEFAREANKHLTRAVMAEAYPEAYRASEAIPLATPSPMPVVRMAIAFLAEWSQRQGLDWKPLFEEGECARL